MDFNTQLYHSPKIDIIGKEVPLAAMEKTGDILQGRYDAAKDTETKTMALTKKLASSSNAADRETANKIMEFYGNKMKGRAEAGDYQNMKWQTQQDAMDAAGMYEGLTNRNKELVKYAEDIDTKSGITDINRRAYEKGKWLKSQSQTAFNPETGVLEGVGVSAPSLYKDVDMAKFTDSYGQGIIADIVGKTTKTEKVFQKGETLPNGQVAPGITVYDIETGRQRSGVTGTRVREVVEKYAKASPEVSAYLSGVEDYYENSLGLSKEQAQQQAYNDVVEKAVQPAIAKYTHSTTMDTDGQGINVGASNYFGSGAGIEPFNPDLHFNTIVSQIDLDKSVEAIRNKQATTSASQFNTDGSFKSTISNTGENKLEMGKMSQVYGMTNEGKEYKTSFNNLVPDWQIKRIKDQHPGYTDKQIFNEFSNQEANASKLLLKKYNISSKEGANVVDANTKRLLTTLPFRVKDGDGTREATGKEIQDALKNGQVSYIPASGQTVIDATSENGEQLSLISALGEQGKSNAANPYQVRMSQMKQMLQGALNPKVAFETTIGKLEMPEPVYNKETKRYENQNTHFRMIKKGELARNEKGEKVYVKADQIQQVNDNGDVVNMYGLNNEGLNRFVTHNLSNAVMDFTEK
jgi:hypothetical protein